MVFGKTGSAKEVSHPRRRADRDDNDKSFEYFRLAKIWLMSEPGWLE